MGAGQMCKGLSRHHETLPPSAMATLGAAMRLMASGRTVTVRGIEDMLGRTGRNQTFADVRRLVTAGLMRREGRWRTGLAVACVFIPGEGR